MSRKLRSFIVAMLGLFAAAGCDEGVTPDDSAVREKNFCTVQCGAGEEMVYEGENPTCACIPSAIAGEAEAIDQAGVEEGGEFSPLDELVDVLDEAEAAYGTCGVGCTWGSCSYSGPCPRCWCGIEGVPHCKKQC